MWADVPGQEASSRPRVLNSIFSAQQINIPSVKRSSRCDGTELLCGVNKQYLTDLK